MASPAVNSQQAAKSPTQIHAASASIMSPGRSAPNGVPARSVKLQTDHKSLPSQPKDNDGADRYAHDRLLFLMANAVGKLAHVTVKNGDKFSGIFSSASVPQTATEPHQYVLKMAKRQLQSQQVNGTTTEDEGDFVGSGEDHTMVFDVKDIAYINMSSISTEKTQTRMSNGIPTGFRTDVDISGNLAGRERELQRWDGGADTALELSTADNGKPWDQFEANERLYGLTTDYDETIYTTAIDTTAANYKQRLAAAGKLAKEIEGSATTNAHIAEERGQAGTADGLDEEDRFSGVKRDFPALSSTQANRYTPPARRAPTGQATVTGAPVDPAIISAQLARPDLNSKSTKDTAAAPIPTISSDSSRKENINPSIISHNVQNDNKVLENTASSRTAAAQDLPVHLPTTPKPEQNSIALPNSAKSVARSAAMPSTALPNTTANVEHEVLNEFRNFAAREKMSITERHRQTARKDRELKLNELKKFASNFKLKTAVPMDMLGILAKDKQKQLDIVEKSQRHLVEQHEAAQVTASSKTSDKSVQQLTNAVADLSLTPAGVPADKVNGRSQRSTQPLQTTFTSKDRTSQPITGPVLSPKAGTLGQRLLQQQQSQFRDRGLQSFSGPSTGGLYGTNSRNGSVSNTTPLSARLNVQAVEFRPNPTAVTFSPLAERGAANTSPSRSKAPPKAHNRVSFFEGRRRPDPSTKKSLKDGFNPIKKMKKEVETQQRTKDFAANGGIPQAYRTPPTWDVSEENKDKTHIDILERPATHSQSVSPIPLAHQHQLPPHLQQGPHNMGQAGHSPGVQAFPHQQHLRAGDPRFDDQRMQFSGSQSSQYPSPRMPQVMLPYNQQMMGQVQPHLAQTVAPFPYGSHPQQVGQLRQFPAQFIAAPNMAAPVILQPGALPFMGVPVHAHNPMFSPGQGHVLPTHVMGQHNNGGPSGYSSPRGAHMMMHQGSQQGHVPPQQVYMAAPQHGNQPYGGQHQPSTPHMRGSIPMTHQPSFGGTPNGPPHYPGGPQRQYSQMGNSYAPQSHPMDHGMSQQQHNPNPAAINAGSEDTK